MDFSQIESLSETDRTQTLARNCGGFALASILFPSSSTTTFKLFASNDSPKGIYQQIQELQADYDGARETFIANSRASDNSKMSLPTAIACVAQNNNLRVKVFYNRSGLDSSSQFHPILAPEETTFTNMDIEKSDVNSYSALSSSTKAHIVLVNGGQHWVTVVKNSSGTNCIYDPADGSISPLADPATIPGYAGLYLELSA
jgi:hypothetical protein